MPRKAKPAPEALAPNLPTTSPAEFHSEQQLVAERNGELQTIDLMFALDNEPYEYARVVSYGRAALLMAAQSALTIGRACLLLKEHEEHGRFTDALAQIGIQPRSAQLHMAAARKFGSESRKLVAARLSSSKLLELIHEPDDDIDALLEGGTVAGMTLDKIDCMTTRELREALRKERTERKADKETTADVVKDKDAKINELDRKLRNIDRLPIRDRAEELLRAMDVQVIAAASELKKLEECMNGVLELYGDIKTDNDVETRLEQAAQLLGARCAEIERIAGV